MYKNDLHNFVHPKCPLPEEFTRRRSGGKKCKTNPISIENRQPKIANLSAQLLIHSFTHPLIHQLMQNKPNFKLTKSKIGNRKSQIPLGHERRINMQNEPNFRGPARKCCNNKDLCKYPHPAMPVSANIEDPGEPGINNQLSMKRP